MKVKDVIAALERCDPEYEVILSKDGEGNDFSPLAEVAGENNVYVPQTTWSGEVRLHHLTPELEARRFSAWDVYDGDDGQRAVVLWPTN